MRKIEVRGGLIVFEDSEEEVNVLGQIVVNAEDHDDIPYLSYEILADYLEESDLTTGEQVAFIEEFARELIADITGEKDGSV